MKLVQFSGEWVNGKIAKTWDEGITIMVHRPWRGRLVHGYLEVDNYFRPDWVGQHMFADKRTRYMKVSV